MCLCWFFRLKKNSNKIVLSNYFTISSAAMTVFDLSLVLECSSARMPFKLSYFIELLLNQLMVLWSSAFLGHIVDHLELTHCLPYGTCGGYVGHTAPNIAAYLDVPFGSPNSLVIISNWSG